jgi:hypothetical protein
MYFDHGAGYLVDEISVLLKEVSSSFLKLLFTKNQRILQAHWHFYSFISSKTFASFTLLRMLI